MSIRWCFAVSILALGLVVALGVLLVRDQLRGYEPDCDTYSFDASQWADAEGDGREDQAEALAECNSLVGLEGEEVTAMLGRQVEARSRDRTMTFSAGWVNDGIGPGDGQSLHVNLSAKGHVVAARLAYPQ